MATDGLAAVLGVVPTVTSSSGFVFGAASITVRRMFERADRLREVVELAGAVHGRFVALAHMT